MAKRQFVGPHGHLGTLGRSHLGSRERRKVHCLENLLVQLSGLVAVKGEAHKDKRVGQSLDTCTHTTTA